MIYQKSKKNALSRAAEPLSEDISKYGIAVYIKDWRIEWREFVIQLNPHTPRTVCKAKINKFIKAAKKVEALEAEEKIQTNIFEVKT